MRVQQDPGGCNELRFLQTVSCILKSALTTHHTDLFGLSAAVLSTIYIGTAYLRGHEK